MKRFFISLMIIIIVLVTPVVTIIGYAHSLDVQYDETYLGAMTDKYNNLKAINDPKIVLIGGSNVPFGIDSALIEREIGMKVVNFGLYAALGSKTTMDLSKVNINKNDIVIFIPEPSAQAYSKYINPEIILQTLDTKKSLIFNIPVNDWFLLANSYPAYIKQKKEFINGGTKPHPTDIYARSSFNAYGDIKYPRPYNIMADMYDTNNIIDIEPNIISADFVEYFNKYSSFIKRHGAKIFFSFSPVNKLSLSPNSSADKRLDFYDYIKANFKADVISNVEDYILDEGYFYDSNFHLNDSGVICRTVKLIGDIKRQLGITIATEVKIPTPSGGDSSGEIVEPEENDDLFAADFIIETGEDRATIIGLSDQGLTKSELVIPMTVKGKPTYKLSGGAFNGANKLIKITIPKSVIVLEDGAFSGAPNLATITLNVSKEVSANLPTVGDGLMNGCNPEIKIYVPKNKYAIMKTNYQWMIHAKYLLSQN